MSFILDALKKSESERQRKGAPGIADVPQGGGASGRSRLMWIIGALLLINLVVLLVLIRRPDAPAVATAPKADVSQPEPGAPAQPPAQRFSEIVAEAKRDRPPVTVTEAVPEPKPAAASAPSTPLSAPQGTARVIDGLPSFSKLRADGTLNMRDLHLDIHVFSSTASERFVFINMNRYREGATLEEGPRVAEITPEGVILEYTGLRFLLPRE